MFPDFEIGEMGLDQALEDAMNPVAISDLQNTQDSQDSADPLGDIGDADPFGGLF